MTNWYLTFAPTKPITLEVAGRVLAAVTRVPVDKVVGELNGNPRDYYWRTITLIAEPPAEGLRIEAAFCENLRGEGDPAASIELRSVTLRDWPEARYAMKLGIYHQLAHAFAALGCSDHTGPSPSTRRLARDEGPQRTRLIDPRIYPSIADQNLPLPFASIRVHSRPFHSWLHAAFRAAAHSACPCRAPASSGTAMSLFPTRR